VEDVHENISTGVFVEIEDDRVRYVQDGFQYLVSQIGIKVNDARCGFAWLEPLDSAIPRHEESLVNVKSS
jgi:hypothetical protein